MIIPSPVISNEELEGYKKTKDLGELGSIIRLTLFGACLNLYI